MYARFGTLHGLNGFWASCKEFRPMNSWNKDATYTVIWITQLKLKLWMSGWNVQFLKQSPAAGRCGGQTKSDQMREFSHHVASYPELSILWTHFVGSLFLHANVCWHTLANTIQSGIFIWKFTSINTLCFCVPIRTVAVLSQEQSWNMGTQKQTRIPTDIIHHHPQSEGKPSSYLR